MIAVTVTFRVAPGAMAAFLPLVTENARRSLADEPGCRRFDVCTRADRPEIFLYELYDSRPDFDAHLASAHFIAFDTAVRAMVRQKDVAIYDEVIE